MTKQQIQQLFQQRYNQNNWKQFLSQVFTNTRLLTTPEILTGINTDVATQAIRLGYIVLNEDGIERHIAIYDVTLAKGIVLERNRVGLRNLLRKYWKDLDAAFIVYHRPETSTSLEANWRFTYVSELTGFDVEGELIKVKTEPKRYTYILGEGESCHTAAERFAIIAKKGNSATLDDVKDAFSVEKLSKAFFEEYKEHYENFVEFLTGKRLVKSGSKWKEKQTGNPNPQLAYIFNGDEKEARDFNKKLLGRIVFLYFIQKKGWMGVPEKSAWGQGDPDFIWKLFENCNNKGIFYSEYLSSLFFDTLNNPNRPNLQFIINNSSLGKVPFLNGGLFEEDNKKYRDLILPAELFEKLFKFFNRYNFTIYEDDPNDHTVAVDPEMLGHIFENLLEDNKDKGAYYTPKEIVHYMCQESLIEYLCTTLKIEDEVKEREAITSLLKNKEIDEILKPEFENINKALDKVKICDPAIGSGAFPMGLLKEIFTAKQTIYTFMHDNTEGFDASGVKLNIIQNSIYGVDIEKGAVDIARLRFWLSLVVDEDEPKALPNLDYKIVVGNSLVSKLGDDIIDIDWDLKEGTQSNLFGQELENKKADLLKKISNEQKEFFKPESDKHKLAADIRKLKINLLINQLQLMVKTQGLETQPSGHGKAIAKQTKLYLQTLGWKQQIEKLKKLKAKPDEPLHFFDWKLDFSEVMNELVTDKVGFDIVIGNPPYVEAKKLKHISQFLKNYRVYSGTADLSSYFFEIGINLSNKNGLLCLINTNKFFNTGYGKAVRSLIVENEIKQLLNFEQVEVFEGILVSSVIISIKNKFPNANSAFPYKKFFKLKNTEFVRTFITEIKNRDSYNQKHLTEKEWSFADSTNLILKNKIEFGSLLLKNIKGVNVYRGITTGYNPAFIISSNEKNELFKSDKKYSEIVKPLLQGRNIRKWIYHFNNNFILQTGFDKNIKKTYPEILEHLKKFQKELEVRADQGKNWWNLRACKYYDEFEKPKIIWGLTADKWAYAYDDKGHYLPSNGYILTSVKIPVKYLLAIINSNLLKYYFGFIGVMTAGGAFTLKHATIQQLPIKIASNQKAFTNKVDEILKYKAQDTTNIEQQIDNMVYKLYELTYEEVKVIDPEFSLSEQEYETIKV